MNSEEILAYLEEKCLIELKKQTDEVLKIRDSVIEMVKENCQKVEELSCQVNIIIEKLGPVIDKKTSFDYCQAAEDKTSEKSSEDNDFYDRVYYEDSFEEEVFTGIKPDVFTGVFVPKETDDVNEEVISIPEYSVEVQENSAVSQTEIYNQTEIEVDYEEDWTTNEEADAASVLELSDNTVSDEELFFDEDEVKDNELKQQYNDFVEDIVDKAGIPVSNSDNDEEDFFDDEEQEPEITVTQTKKPQIEEREIEFEEDTQASNEPEFEDDNLFDEEETIVHVEENKHEAFDLSSFKKTDEEDEDEDESEIDTADDNEEDSTSSKGKKGFFKKLLGK